MLSPTLPKRSSIACSHRAGIAVCGSVPSIASSYTVSGSVDVLQVPLAGGKHGHAPRQRRADEGAGRLREHRVPALCELAEPGGLDDVEPEVALGSHRRLAGVQADPHPDGHALGPRSQAVRPLDLDRSEDGVARAREREEERVTLSVDLDAALGAEATADDGAMPFEHVRVPLAEPPQQVRGRLDVREGERDRAAGQRGLASGCDGAVGRKQRGGLHPEVHALRTGGQRCFCRGRTAVTRRT